MTFGLDNLPYGSVVPSGGRPFAAVRFGDAVLDLGRVNRELFAAGNLDAFLAAGPKTWAQVRAAARRLIEAGIELVPLTQVQPVLAFTVADYVDFYASEHHATNAGRIFRPQGDPLPVNWKHLPVGYHGRSASVVASGTPVERPAGIVGPGGYGPSERLDFEAEVAFVVGRPGRRIPVAAADEHVFGICLLNDWSARDVQAFETVPLGPFLGKSFATSVSAWITPLAALSDARCPAPPQEPAPLPHLAGGNGLDLALEVRINGDVVSRPSFTDTYWTYAQMLAHLTSNGAAVRPGDLFASGTVSGPLPDQRGCLLELTENGAHPLDVGGQPRTWLRDGDTVTIVGRAGDVSLAEVSGRVVPAG